MAGTSWPLPRHSRDQYRVFARAKSVGPGNSGHRNRVFLDGYLDFRAATCSPRRVTPNLKAIVANPALFAEDPLRKELANASPVTKQNRDGAWSQLGKSKQRSSRSLFALLVASWVLVLAGVSSLDAGADWIRPGITTNQAVWGIRGGLLWAVAPSGFRGGEPRGLIRLGYPVLPDHSYDLINFIAVEPIVGRNRGFSELERSQLDGIPGKRIWVEPSGIGLTNGLASGELRKGPDGQEELQVDLRVEKFDNGAHVRLTLIQRSDRPDEIQLSASREPDSAPLEYCILTATMGNMARTRLLWLSNERVSSLKVYADYEDKGFTPHKEYPLSRLYRTSDGRVLVAVTNDEEDPALAYPFPNSRFWHYAGCKVTQYWAKDPGTFRDDLQAVVNGRYTYWQSSRPIPGGVAFENFEMRERFYDRQRFVFGITRKTPREFGFTNDHH